MLASMNLNNEERKAYEISNLKEVARAYTEFTKSIEKNNSLENFYNSLIELRTNYYIAYTSWNIDELMIEQDELDHDSMEDIKDTLEMIFQPLTERL